MELQSIWFILMFVLVAGYTILDGFDLGVGVLHGIAKDKTERDLYINSIGPVWDGNEVWLLAGGGALFAAFPVAYATIFSSFYLALMLVLYALIGRAVSLEFRHQIHSEKWIRFWDKVFCVSSFLPALLLGVALGNVLRGIPLDETMTFTGSFFGLLNPYALLVGVLGLVLFIMHGAAWLALKTEGDLQKKMQSTISKMWIVSVIMFFVVTLATYFLAHHLFDGTIKNPLFWVIFLVLLGSMFAIPVLNRPNNEVKTFLASCGLLIGLVSLAGLSMYPNLLPSLTDMENSLTIYNAASTPRTQQVMLVIALIGMPLVLIYTFVAYRSFSGKVKADSDMHY